MASCAAASALPELMSVDICVSTAALGGTPVMRLNRRSACSVGPASTGVDRYGTDSAVIATASVMRTPDLIERSNISLNSLTAFRRQSGRHHRHDDAPRVMSPRDDAPCNYVNRAMLNTMKLPVSPGIRSPEHDATHGLRTVRLFSY